MPRVVHFEIQADNPGRAASFRHEVLGWKVSKWEGPLDCWLVSTGEAPEPGIDGAITTRQGKAIDEMAVTGYVCTVQLDDVDAYVRKAVEAGGRVSVPKTEIPQVGFTACCKDTEATSSASSSLTSPSTGEGNVRPPPGRPLAGEAGGMR